MKQNAVSLAARALPVAMLPLVLSTLAAAYRHDLTADGCVSWPDLAALADKWLADDCSTDLWCNGADLDHSDAVDFNDLVPLGEHWRDVYPYGVTLLVSHEPYQTHVQIDGPHPADRSATIAPQLLGGTTHHIFGSVPSATEGDYVLGITWTNEADRKVEFGYDFTQGFTFDLDTVDEIAFDVFVPSGGLLFGGGLIGVWDSTFGWHTSANLPTAFDQWHTIVVDVTDLSHTDLNEVDALVFEDMGQEGDTAGTLFVDNVRLRRINPEYYNLTATAHDSRIDLQWQPVSTPALKGYNIYRADDVRGPFTKQNTSPYTLSVYTDFLGENGRTHFYYITSGLDAGETARSSTVGATTYAMTDEQLVTSVQQATFRYFWDFGHPVSGLTREGSAHPADNVTTGGSGFGLMAIVVGAERAYISRAQAAQRTLKILTFLGEQADRHHGAWPHWLSGTTGRTIPFTQHDNGQYDNGGDLVETAFLVQGILAARQYFDAADPVESEIRSRAEDLWRGVEWDWYLHDGEVLYWHWSPNYGWTMNMPIVGYNECMIAYILAIASPTHPIPPSCYYDGWARESWYANGNYYYGYRQWVGPAYGGPLFWTHYSFLGFDPRNKADAFCNYFDNSRNISLINRAHCINNPNGFAAYSDLLWGLSASCNPWRYSAHSPTNDNGTITPTAALSAMPYTPAESIAVLKHLYHTYGDRLWGPFGFYDALNPEEDWFCDEYLAIDQGPIVVMIENHLSALCWDLFMSSSEITPALQSIGWTTD